MKGPPIPAERTRTWRQALVDALRSADAPRTARDLSTALGLAEKDVLDHLEHVRRSQGDALVVVPARCRSCGYDYPDRERLGRPGRCPACRSERIDPPRFLWREEG